VDVQFFEHDVRPGLRRGGVLIGPASPGRR
jgi:hypothetical protein